MLIDEMAAILAVRPDLPAVKIADAAEDNWTFLQNAIPFGAEVIPLLSERPRQPHV